MEETDVEVRAVKEVGTDTVAVDLASPPTFEAKPGQFVKLSATVDGEHVSRFYTISSPDVGGEIEITVEVDPEGSLGPWLADAKGQTIRLEGPYGTAFYEDESSILVLAGGPGVGPAVGIGERALADDNEMAIVYRDDDPVHEERLSALRERGTTVIVVGEDQGLETALADAYEAGQQVFIYGFRDFVTEGRKALESVGGDPDDAKIENFG